MNNKDEQETVFIKYLVADEPPKKGLKRMHYYTELPSKPGKYFFGMSYHTEIERDSIRNMVKKGQVIELLDHVEMPLEKDLWLDEDGKVIMAKGYAPWDDKPFNVIAEPKALKKSHVILQKQLNKKNLPNISKRHVIHNS
jgi:hypothetical protein